jgi:hypothetical protein
MALCNREICGKRAKRQAIFVCGKKNPNIEIRSKVEARNSERLRSKPLPLLRFRILDFQLVSDFDIRISNFSARNGTIISATTGQT